MDKEQAIQEILSDLEHQPLQERRTFRAYLNQPELISISSANAEYQSPPNNGNTNNCYFNFTVNLPRPALDTKSLQLLKAIIPQAQCSIPDYSLVFPYYRLRTVPINNTDGIGFLEAPSYSNLYYIRLLPSYYKPELFHYNAYGNIDLLGFNKTFNDYEELLVELNKACKQDLSPLTGHYTPFDVSFTYNKELNKFVFNGLNVGEDYPLWNFIQLYVKTEVVKLIDKDDNILYYVCILSVTVPGTPPDEDPTHWLEVGEYYGQPNFNNYLIAGYDDPNVKKLLLAIQKQGNDNNDITFPPGIPGQPFVQGQTLARRLGFTWDSTGLVTNLVTFNDHIDGLDYDGTGILFYNRLRPIPFYFPPGTLGATLTMNENITDSYTADGYCNLVYSSIISIYTIVVGTSSVDTQRNANLLAMVEMNCGNLGIAMASGFIDTKLTKIQPDIYSIYIELRDENGQPYYLTNNATTTLLLKLTYD